MSKKKLWIKVAGYVWCDVHGSIHEDMRDVYDESMADCEPANWRPVAVLTDDPLKFG